LTEEQYNPNNFKMSQQSSNKYPLFKLKNMDTDNNWQLCIVALMVDV